MISANDINTAFEVYSPTIEGIGGIIGILSFIWGCFTTIYCRFAKVKANDAKISAESAVAKVNEYEIVIGKLKAENAQIAQVIYNSGLTLTETDQRIDEKTRNKPDMFIQPNEPTEKKNNMIWISGDENDRI